MEVDREDIDEIHEKMNKFSTTLTRSITIQEGTLEEIKSIKKDLHDPRTGLAPRVTKIETTGGVVKWIAGGGLLAGASNWFKDLFHQ